MPTGSGELSLSRVERTKGLTDLLADHGHPIRDGREVAVEHQRVENIDVYIAVIRRPAVSTLRVLTK